MTTTPTNSGTSMRGRRSISMVLLTVVAALALPGLAQAAPTFGVAVSHAPITVAPYAPTPVAHDDRLFTYSIDVTDTGTGADPSDSPSVVGITLPSGVTPDAKNRAGALSGDGWTCDANALTCTRSDPAAAGVAFPMITVKVNLDGSAPDQLTATATMSGGGAAGTTSGQDTFTLAPARSFGVSDFTTSVVDANGVDVTQAGAHPYSATTSFRINSYISATGELQPVEDPKTVDLALPPGFTGNPQSVPYCAAYQSTSRSCPVSSQVGVATVDVLAAGPVTEPVYNVKPSVGHPAEFTFNANGVGDVYLFAQVRSDGDYGLTVHTPYTTEARLVSATFTFWGVPADPAHDAERCRPGFNICIGGATSTAPLLPFLTNPTNCSTDPPVSTLTVDSWQHPGATISSQAASPLLTGCDKLSFSPSISVVPDSKQADAPSGYTVDLSVPQTNDPNTLATPPLKDATVTLPRGVILNAGVADGLQGCTDAQFGEHTGQPASCPAAAQIGTIAVTSPLLDHQLPGAIYLRAPDPGAHRATGLYAIFLDIEDPVSGVIVKLRGTVVPDAVTGQLTATFTGNPQLPFSDLQLTFKGGGRAALANPQTCGANTTTATLSSWGGPTATPTSSFTTSWDGLGSPCPVGLPFAPTLTAGTASDAAGASSPFTFAIGRDDRQDVIDGLSATLPAGLLASIKGVPLCSDVAASTATCPADTRVGSATVAAGSGPNPYYLKGTVSLTGAYKGGPYGLAIAVHAVAGPLDLGWVVVRQSIQIDPNDAHLTVVSDPIPTIQEGAPFRLRTIDVTIDRPGFMRSPTSCDPKTISATVHSVGGATAALSRPFQVSGCAKLPFAPKLAMRLTGATQTEPGGHPGVEALLTQQPGEANLKSVTVTLPLSLALDPDNAVGLCEFGDGLKDQCPARSVIGTATAVSPLLNRPLTGKVYFVKGLRADPKTGRLIKTLPTLLLELRGEIDLNVRAVSSVPDGKHLVTTFPLVPDAQISAFDLSLAGGKHGIIVVTNDQSTCAAEQQPFFTAIGQNGKRVDRRSTMAVQCDLAVSRTFTSRSVHARVTGIGAGVVTISGAGVKATRRTIRSATAATVVVPLNAEGRKLRRAGHDVRLRVSFVAKGTRKAKVASSARPAR